MLFFGAVGALAPVDGVVVWVWQRMGLLVAVLLLLAAAGHSGPNLIFSFHWSLSGTSLFGPAVWVGAGLLLSAYAICMSWLFSLSLLANLCVAASGQSRWSRPAT